MGFKTILVPLSAPDASRSALHTALLLAQRSQAHVEAIHVRPDPRGLIPYTGEGMDGSMIEEIMEATESEGTQRASETREMFESFCTEHALTVSSTPRTDAGLTVSWREDSGREDEVIAIRGRLYDLVVVGRPVTASPLPSPITLESALHDSGRPILVAPPDPPEHVGDHVAIAWEASPEAARTIAVSIQALAQASRVTVLSANLSPPLPLLAEELVDRLKWHGVEAEVRPFDSAVTELGASYLREAAAAGADMLVKGAYSQSRLRQMVLGGRTRHILNHTTIPVLLAK